MIYEYAVEPTLIAKWAREGIVGLAGQFGLDQRRLVSDFPVYWEGEVATALLEMFDYDAGDPDYVHASNFLHALLDFLTTNMICRGYRRDATKTWVQQAQQVHEQEPFHAILVSSNPNGHPALITDAVLNSPLNRQWYLPTVNSTAKAADALATTLETILRGATRIVIVDPYFDPRDRSFREVLAALVQRAIDLRCVDRAPPEVTLISGVSEGRPDGGVIEPAKQLENEAYNRCEWAQHHLRACIPRGTRLTFMCVANFQDGDRLHNRFVLTDFAGASLPYGTQSLEGVFDDISPLFRGQYQRRWRQYTRPEQLKIVGAPRVIEGCG